MEQFFEGSPKVQIEDGINNRIEGRVDIAKPGDEVDKFFTWTTDRTEGQNHVHKEKGQPADDEHAHNDAKGSRGSSLFA